MEAVASRKNTEPNGCRTQRLVCSRSTEQWTYRQWSTHATGRLDAVRIVGETIIQRDGVFWRFCPCSTEHTDFKWLQSGNAQDGKAVRWLRIFHLDRQ